MLPNEYFVQITNCPENIAFAGNLKVELIDQCQQVLQDITPNFFYKEFIDTKGVSQIAFEFGNIGIDYQDELLFLKLSHTASTAVWYSVGFFITNHLQEETTRFEYKNESYFKGISYDTANFYQSIRLTCFKNDADLSVENEEYTQMSGSVISLRSIITPVDKYVFYVCDFFTHKRLTILLNHDLIFIDGYQISNKPAVTKGDRIEDSNLFTVDFETNPTDVFKGFLFQINKSADCVVSPWTDWSTCSNGKQSRTRTIIHSPEFGGAYCPVLIETRTCVLPVDCVVSVWGAWSDWSVCSGGTQTRTRIRTIITPAANGGTACPVLSETESQACVDPTPVITTSWYSSNGDTPPLDQNGEPSEAIGDTGSVTYWLDAAHTIQTTKTFQGARQHLGTYTPAPCLSFTHYGIISTYNVSQCNNIL